MTPESNVNFSWPGRKSIPRAYELKGWDFQGHPLLTNEQHAAFYSNFVKICGPHVEYLKLTKCIIFKETDSSLKSPPHGFIVLLQKLGPEMVTLEIQDCWFHSQQESRAEKLPHLRKLVITKCRGLLAPMSLIQFPNLTELVIHGVINSTICDYDYISTFAMLRRFYQRNPILNLTRLDTLCLEERSASLIVANFPLKHLQISVTTESETRSIVEHYGPRLETLQLHKLCRKNNREVFWNFPFGVKFEILTELELWGDFVPSLDFLTAIPLLHKLRLDVNCLDLKQNVNRQTEILEIDDLIPQSTGLMSKNFEMVLLTEISFDWEAAPDSWFQLASWMPYLKSIHAPVSAQAFKTIFENWDRLEIFRARYGSCIDDDALLSVDLPRTLQKFKIETGCGQSHISNASIRKIFPGREKFQELTLSATFEQVLIHKIHKSIRILFQSLLTVFFVLSNR